MVMGLKFSRKSGEERTKEYEQKITSISQSVQNFKNELSESFIMGTNMANAFKRCFKIQFEKKGLSATRRWCEDVFKKLKKLDESNRALRAKYIRPVSQTIRMSRGGEVVESKSTAVGRIPREFKTQNIKEFKKIFYNTTAFDVSFFGTEITAKLTFSQRAAINEVKKQLNELCDDKNFAYKPQK